MTAYQYGYGSAVINSADLLQYVQHPDPATGAARLGPSGDASQRDGYTYDALGEVLTAADRNGTVYSYAYDVLGRRTADAVTTLGANVDGSVRRIDTAYDTQGNAYLVTSYTSATQADAAHTANQVLRQYNGLGQLTAEFQSHTPGQGVNLNTSLAVCCTYSQMADEQCPSIDRSPSSRCPSGGALDVTFSGP